jgi:phage gpG-like protein
MARNAYIDINGIQTIKVLLDRLSGGIGSRRLMSEIATFLITSIKLRTAGGKDVNENAFDPYSKGYAMFRAKEGYPINKVDLFFSGSMMASMDYKATSDTATLFFNESEDKSGTSNPNKAFWLNKKREFFALSENDQREVENMVDDSIDEILRS